MSGSQLLMGFRKLWVIKDVIVTAYKNNPRLGNACTGCVTFSLGDVLAQKIEQKTGGSTNIDLWRAAQIGALGLTMNGFFLHHWYHTLDRVVGSSMKSKVGVATKVIADQLLYAPFAICTFFYFMVARSSSSITEANQRFLTKMELSFTTTFFADCMLWPASNFVNFRFITLAYRPSFSAVIQLMWQTYLSATTTTTSPMLVAGMTSAADLEGSVSSVNVMDVEPSGVVELESESKSKSEGKKRDKLE